MGDKKSTLREYFEALLIAVLFLRFANVFVVQTFYIPSGSMEDTLLIGDHLFVNRFIFGSATAGIGGALPHRELQRGDIVVFRSPEDRTTDLVKRCIGLAGDTVEVRGKELFLNGQPVNDAAWVKHLPAARVGYDPRRDDYRPFTVPAGHLFCMGDNRENSRDSRYFGSVPRSLIKGRAGMIYWSYGGEVSDGTARPLERLKLLAKTLWGLPTKSRWSRTFDVPR